jgi:SAM-dependent methyltransferase
MQPESYTDEFYEFHLQGALTSASGVIPVVMEFIKPNSVLDVGCGIGAWLLVWEKMGITDIFGIDGNFINTSKLRIDQSKFLAMDLEKGFKIDRKFDLVSCLEVAEHLPEKSAELFIKSLCMAGDIILFSAAIPGQGGTLHLNEQYPDYWVNQFQQNGFIPIDCIRPKIWNDKNIQWWYRQNILFFVKSGSLPNFPLLQKAFDNKINEASSVVHPELFEDTRRKADYYKSILGSGWTTIKYFIRTYFKKKN